MLNDLEQRRSSEPARPVDLDWLTGQAEPQKKPTAKRWLPIGLLLLVVIAVTAAAWQLLWVEAKPPAAPAPIAASEIKPEPVTPATLNAMQWTRQDSVTRARIQLSEGRAYSVQKQPPGLRLRFFGVQSGLNPARMSVEPPVESIAVQRAGEDLLVTLKISGEFSFSDRLPGTGGTEIELIIEPEMPAPVAATTAQAGDKIEPASSAADNKPAVKAASTATAPGKPAPVAAKKAVNSKQAQLTPSQQDMQLADLARNLIRRGDSYRAEDLLQDFISRQPDAIRSGRLLASLWLSQQRYQAAESLLLELLAKYPGDIELRLQRGQLLLARGDAAAAVDWLMSASPNIDQYPQYYELLGLAARKNQQYALSEQTYRGLLATDERRGDWLVGLGIALDAQARTAEARQVYRQAVQARTISAALKQYAQQRLASN